MIGMHRRDRGGPGRIRTYDQGIHAAPVFPPGVDYLFTLVPSTGQTRRSTPVVKGLEASVRVSSLRRSTTAWLQSSHQARARRLPLNSSPVHFPQNRHGAASFDRVPPLTPLSAPGPRRPIIAEELLRSAGFCHTQASLFSQVLRLLLEGASDLRRSNRSGTRDPRDRHQGEPRHVLIPTSRSATTVPAQQRSRSSP